MSWLRDHRYLVARRLVQAGVLVLFWLGAHSSQDWLVGNLSSSKMMGLVPLSDPFAILQVLATGHAVAATALLGAAIVLVLYLLVGGRAFCGWVCPVNPIADAGAWTRRRLPWRGQVRVPRSGRLYTLGLALALSAIMGVAAFEWVSPIGILQREILYGPGLGLLVIPAILLFDVAVVKTSWCRSLCPLGGFYSVVGHASLLRVRFDGDRCDRCGDCLHICPEPHVLHLERAAVAGQVLGGDCLNCGRCIEICPQGALGLGLTGPRPTPSSTPSHPLALGGGPHATDSTQA